MAGYAYHYCSACGSAQKKGSAPYSCARCGHIDQRAYAPPYPSAARRSIAPAVALEPGVYRRLPVRPD